MLNGITNPRKVAYFLTIKELFEYSKIVSICQVKAGITQRSLSQTSSGQLG